MLLWVGKTLCLPTQELLRDSKAVSFYNSVLLFAHVSIVINWTGRYYTTLYEQFRSRAKWGGGGVAMMEKWRFGINRIFIFAE